MTISITQVLKSSPEQKQRQFFGVSQLELFNPLTEYREMDSVTPPLPGSK